MSRNRSAWMTPDGRPDGQRAFEEVEFGGDEVRPGRARPRWRVRRTLEQRPPAVQRQRVGALDREIGAGQMHVGEHGADLTALGRLRAGAAEMPSRKVTMAARPAGERASISPERMRDRARAIDATAGQMLHQAQKERQVARIDALFIERQDEHGRRRWRSGNWNSRRPRRCPSANAARRYRSAADSADSSSSRISV